jgi:hypothetical protein
LKVSVPVLKVGEFIRVPFTEPAILVNPDPAPA